ncbi:MAG TPA: hypothetical protein DIC60_05955 [Lachnospiraceae bacterium]|nr:hypothetical protein [Lachnospiraceae bacterium]
MKKKKLSNNKKKLENTVKYVCSSCGAKELIPFDVIEYFDEKNLEQLLLQGKDITSLHVRNV